MPQHEPTVQRGWDLSLEGKTLDVAITGLFSLGKDVTPELAREAISSVRVVGMFRASQAVKDALADRMK